MSDSEGNEVGFVALAGSGSVLTFLYRSFAAHYKPAYSLRYFAGLRSALRT